MIICPQCKKPLNKDNQLFVCYNCSYTTINDDSIIVFENIDSDNNDYSSEDLNILVKYEEKHFWFKRRKDYILYFINKCLNKKLSFIEIGSGTSYIAKALSDDGYNISIGDIYSNGFKFALKSNISNLYQFDLYKAPFEKQFDVICMFDVLEHLDDEVKALKNIHKMLNNNGFIVLTVPAHKWLWSNYDVIANHKRRYTTKDLVNLLTNNDFKVTMSKNFL